MLFCAIPVLAQGEYLKKGENGFELMGGYLFGGEDDATGYGIQVSYSFLGDLDIGFAMANVKGKINDFYVDGSSTAYSPFIIIHFNKKNRETLPLAFALMIGAESINLKAKRIDLYESNYSSSLLKLGVSVYGDLLSSDNTIIQPVVQLMFNKNIKDANDMFPVIGVGASMFFKLSKSNSAALRINPMSTIYKGEASHSLNIGLILPIEAVE